MAADYPDGINTSGPTISRLAPLPIEYQPDVYKNDDGGVDVNVQPCGVRAWQIDYFTLTAAEVTTLRTHFNDARSKVETFNFYNRTDATLYGEVQYKSFKIGKHKRVHANAVSVVLVAFQ